MKKEKDHKCGRNVVDKIRGSSNSFNLKHRWNTSGK